MGTRALEQIFTPRSIAVIGASERDGSLGGAVIKNILAGGFDGGVYPVNAKAYKEIHGLAAYAKIGHVEDQVDLAIVCTPADTIGKVMDALHKANVSAAVIMTGGSARNRAQTFKPSRKVLKAARQGSGVRILGPDCLGVISPHHKLNASASPAPVSPGDIAYIGQSGALANAITDWAASRKIGFSHVVTLGQSDDIKLSDAVNFLSQDKKVKTLLVHLDDFQEGEQLLRALRAASKRKLVLVVKSNRFSASPLADYTETRGITNRDKIIDHALQRAGVLRVDATDELFDCVDTLQQRRSLKGDRLAIVTNSRGGAILAVDRLMHDKGRLAELEPETQRRLRVLLPEYISTHNPILLNPELKPEHLVAVTEEILKDKGVDALLFVYTPGMGTDSKENAIALAKVSSATAKSVFSCWMGDFSVAGARSYLDDQKLPTFDTPDNAIKAFMYQVKHTRTQELMRETPESYETLGEAQESILHRLPANDVVNPQLAWDLIRSYGFPAADNHFYLSQQELLASSGKMSPPWVVKIHHHDYLKPFAYGLNARQRWRSVALNIKTKKQLSDEMKRLKSELKLRFEGSEILGYSIQPMHRAMDNLQISFGIGRDDEVGPFIFFGGGGSTADILVDRQVALPPLNTALARQLIERTHVSEVLKERAQASGYAQELTTLSRWLVATSQISHQYPTISGLEMNAIRKNDGSYQVLGVAGETAEVQSSFIKAYPGELEEEFVNSAGQRFLSRPIRAEDETNLADFYRKLSPDTLRFRFFTSRRNFDHKELARFSQIDYDREMAFVAIKNKELAGIVRVWIDPDDIIAEFSVLVGDAFAGQQLGYLLMTKIINYLKNNRNVLQIVGSVLPHNGPMLKLADRLGFVRRENKAEGMIELVMNLTPPEHAWQKQRMYTL